MLALLLTAHHSAGRGRLRLGFMISQGKHKDGLVCETVSGNRFMKDLLVLQMFWTCSKFQQHKSEALRTWAATLLLETPFKFHSQVLRMTVLHPHSPSIVRSFDLYEKQKQQEMTPLSLHNILIYYYYSSFFLFCISQRVLDRWALSTN